MSYGVDFEHSIPCPVRIGPKETGPVHPGGWSPIWACEGWWSNVDIYLDVPRSWAAVLTEIELRLTSLTGAVRSVVAQTTVTASGLQVQPDGARTGIAISGRGHPGSGWLLEARNPSPITSVPTGQVSAELWGTESTPDGIGSRAGRNIADRAFPSRAAHLMGWPSGVVPPVGPVGPWLPVAVDPLTGHLIVDAVVVVPPPPPLVVGEVSRFQNLITLAQAAVKAAPGRVFSATAQNVTGALKYFQLHDKIGALVPADIPEITIAVPAGATVILGNDFFGQPIASSPLLGGLFFPTGIRWGWSTSLGTYVAAPATSQATQILFV